MRIELYADSRDEWKWSVAVRHARETGQSIFWVVMLRPTVGQHGNDRAPVAGALPEVTRFFAQERRHLDEGQAKSLARVTKLCSQLGIELFSHMEAYPATLGQRGHYIGAIVRALEARQSHLKHLVLLDPDNGVGKASTDGKQVHLTHLQWVWNALREGDTLAIVQFQHRMPDWVAALQNRVAETLGISVQQVRSFPWANLCLYLIDRPSEDPPRRGECPCEVARGQGVLRFLAPRPSKEETRAGPEVGQGGRPGQSGEGGEAC